MKKILVVRFSSIGDVVLTTPILRCIGEQLPNTTIHFLTKDIFASLIESNPHVDRVITMDKSIHECIPQLRKERYDCIIDLHHNIRTKALQWKLKIPMYSFPKLNIKKWIYVRFKKDILPNLHIVDRYFSAVRPLGVVNDGHPGELYLGQKDTVQLASLSTDKKIVAIALGAQFATKRLPIHKLLELVNRIPTTVLLMGGKTDIETAAYIEKNSTNPKIVNACGKYTLMESASLVSQANLLVTHDTGLMHIAACFNTPIVSIWGNTTPRLGMYPYRPKDFKQESYSMHQVDSLSCRPCSKIGYNTCPKSHFDCMEKQDIATIVSDIFHRIS